MIIGTIPGIVAKRRLVGLLDAQRTYQQARILHVIAQANRYSDTVALFTALGGGWWNHQDVTESYVTPPP